MKASRSEKPKTILQKIHIKLDNTTRSFLFQFISLLVIYSLSVETSLGQNVHKDIRSIDRNVQETNSQKNKKEAVTISTLQNSLKKSNAKIIFARSTSYNKDEAVSDPDTRADKTSSLISIQDVKAQGLGVVAVDHTKIPYGSVIITPSKEVYVAVNRGGAVQSRKAARVLAARKGLSENSPESRALVLDFYSYSQVGNYWDYFTVIPYTGTTPFRDLKRSEKIAYLRAVRRII